MRFKQLDVRSGISLRSKMVFGGLLILLIPMTIVGSVTYINSSRTLEGISSLQLVQIAASFSGMIQIVLQKDVKNLTSLANDPKIISDMQDGRYNKIQERLKDLFILLAADFEGLGVYDANGIIIGDGMDETRAGISIAERNYFKAAKKGKTGVGPMVHSKATGAPVFGLSAPIISSSGRFLGGVLGVVKAEYLTKYIASLKLGATGYVFMIDQNGTVIAHPDKSLILDVNIREIPEVKPLADKMLRQKSQAVEYSYLGVEKIAGIYPVSLTGWSIGACQNKNEIMALAYSNMNFLLMVIGVLVILFILAVLIFSKRVSAPVQSTLITLNQAIDQAAEAFLIIGLDGKVQFANPAAAVIVGRSKSDIIGNPLRMGAELSRSEQEILKAMKEETIWSGRIEGTRQGGSGYIMALTLTPVLNAAGKLMCYLAVGRDITEESMLHEKYQQSQKMEAIGALAGGIAHDFNNILSAVFGYTELALTSLEDKGKIEHYLKQILGAAARARDLVSHILTFSRKADLGRKPIVPKYIIKEALKLLRASLPSTIEIREWLKSSAAILGNETQIHQMTMNLCSNAGYAMENSGGVLEITLDEIEIKDDLLLQYPDLQPGRYLRFITADSGSGIPGDVLERIFEPFFTTKPVGEGTGLGLSVVHGIVISLGGGITVDSEPGQGTVFTILLPIVEIFISHVNEVERKELPGGTERVLLVDDEEAIVQSMQTLLIELGYRVRAFNQSAMAWEEFASHPDEYDIIITDYTMPKLTGVALSEMIRHVRPDIPIILCSGYLTLEDKLEHLRPIEFLRKPVTAIEYARTLRQVLDESGET